MRLARFSSTASARALYVTGASPDGHERHFWVPATITSTPQRSVATSEPPSVTTASAMSSASWERASRPISARGWSTPVDVSPWIMATMRVRPPARARAMASGSMTRPHSARTGTTSAPQRSAISIMSRPKRPHSPITTRSPGSRNETMAASSPARPVPDTGKARSFRVWKTTRRRSITSFMTAVNSGSNWPRSGVAMARSTRGSAMVGPGPSRMRGPGRRSPGESAMTAESSGCARSRASAPSGARGQPESCPLVVDDQPAAGGGGLPPRTTLRRIPLGHSWRATRCCFSALKSSPEDTGPRRQPPTPIHLPARGIAEPPQLPRPPHSRV